MGQRNTGRKQKKRKDRERRVKKEKTVRAARRDQQAWDATVRRMAPLPEFEVRAGEHDEDIRELVNSGLEGLCRTYTNTLTDVALAAVIEQRKNGWSKFIADQCERFTDLSPEDVTYGFTHLIAQEFGDQILRTAKKNLFQRTMPTSSFTILPEEDHWVIDCRSLDQRKTRHGGLYQSPHRPTIVIDGTDREVLFSMHAIRQLADRINPYWKSYYIGQVYVFGFLYECVHFGQTVLTNGQTAIVVYNSCLRGGAGIQASMRKLLQVDDDFDLKNHYYVVGYCPLVIDDDIVVAKTFLTPGYWTTPERQTIKKGCPKLLIRDIEQACDDGVNVVSISSCKRTQLALDWFHHHGVPQVIRIDGEVFRGMAGPYARVMDELNAKVPPSEAS